VGFYRFALQMSGSEASRRTERRSVPAVDPRKHAYDPGRGSVQSFLYGVARNHVLRALERNRERRWTTKSNHAIRRRGYAGKSYRAEALEAVRQAVLALPTHYREVVALCDLEEMDYAGAASALAARWGRFVPGCIVRGGC